MVSLGDTAISLHILQPPLGGRGDLESQNPKWQDLPKFQFSGGGGVLGGGWDGGFWTKFQNRVNWGIWAQNLPSHFLYAFASQIVSHILRMWILKQYHFS